MPLFLRGNGEDASPGRGSEASASGESSTWIGGSAVLEGRLSSPDDICIHGKVEGVVESQGEVLIPEGGRVRADITAKRVVVFGEVEGKIVASERAEIGDTGALLGDISAAQVRIEPGARFNGVVLGESDGAASEPQPDGERAGDVE